MAVHSWQDLAKEPTGERHVVQLYRDRAFLQQATTAWLAPALRAGGGAILVCTAANRDLVLAGLRGHGIDPAPLLRQGRIEALDAERLRTLVARGGAVDVPAFKRIAASAVARVRAAGAPGAEIHAWGELVNLLWHAGAQAAAERLEAAWNEVIDAHGIRLLCSYEIDNLAPETHEEALRRVCGSHSQLIPEADYERFDLAVGRALVEVFGEQEAGLVRLQHARRRRLPTAMPTAEAVLLGLHDADPETARRVLRLTRAHLLGPEAA